MATKAYLWRTIPVGVEGSACKYVDSKTGSDLNGNGTRANPYQSLGKAYRTGTKPTLIICRGLFSEQMADGNHSCEIRGDYFGAAVFDGNGIYVLYGFGHSKLIIRNTGVGSANLAVAANSGLFAGVGRAINDSSVGSAGYVHGVAGSSVLMDRCSHYWGCIGGTTAVQYVGISRPRHNDTYLIALGAQGMTHGTLYDCAIADRCKHFTNGTSTYSYCVFSKFALIANDPNVAYNRCLFASDCKWYYLSGNRGDDGTVRELTITGSTTAERQASLVAALTAVYDELEIAAGSRIFPSFTYCEFTTQTDVQIFNNATCGDFTIIPNSDGDIRPAAYYQKMGFATSPNYYGAFPPSVNIPIMSDSSGVAGTWDENSAYGCVTVADNAICLDETSVSKTGGIMSKIVKINPETYKLSGIFAPFTSKFTDYFAYLNKKPIEGTPPVEGQELSIGRYIVVGSVIYNGQTYSDKSILLVTETQTTYRVDTESSYLIYIDDPNRPDVIYCRSRATIYVKIKASDGLQSGGVYLNIGNDSITYDGRTIAAGESFVAVDNIKTFSHSNPNYQVGIVFDDTRVPSAEWIPAQMFGEYFVSKQSGAVVRDGEDIPVSSGNPLSYIPSEDEGYSDILRKTVLNQAYCQFEICVRRI